MYIPIETMCCVGYCWWTGLRAALDNKQGESQVKERMTATDIAKSLQERMDNNAVEHVRPVMPKEQLRVRNESELLVQASWCRKK